eukprot:g42808.t1
MSLQVVTAKMAEVELKEAVVALDKVNAERKNVQTKDGEPAATSSAEEIKQHHLPPLSNTTPKDSKSAMKSTEAAQNGDTFNADGTVMEAPRTVKKSLHTGFSLKMKNRIAQDQALQLPRYPTYDGGVVSKRWDKTYPEMVVVVFGTLRCDSVS